MIETRDFLLKILTSYGRGGKKYLLDTENISKKHRLLHWLLQVIGEAGNPNFFADVIGYLDIFLFCF